MAKSKTGNTKLNRNMSITITEIPQLTEVQASFDAQLNAIGLLKDAIAKQTEGVSAVRSEKVSGFVKAAVPLSPAPPPTTAAITEFGKIASRDIKAAEDRAEETKTALNSLLKNLDAQITRFEEQHRTDAIQVYEKRLKEICQGETQKEKIKATIDRLKSGSKA